MARRQPSFLQRVWLSPRARRIVLVSFLAVVAFGLAVLTALWTRACAGNSCPSIAELGGYDPNQASKVYAADGRLITDLGLERRTVVPLGEMSPYVKAAFITTEDKRFYEHHGIDWYRVFGAIKNNISKFRVAEGFSTITMQLARNLWPEDISGRDKTLRRKLREAQVAREIEAQVPQGQDPRALPQPDRPREPGLRRRGGLPALLRQVGARPQRRRSGHARRHSRRRRPATIPRKNPNLSVQRRNTVLNLLRDNGLLSRRRTPSGGRRTRCCSRRTRTSAASPSTSSSTSGSSSTRASAPTSTSRAIGSTPRSTSTPSRPPSGRSRPGSRRSRAGPTASSPGRRYRQYLDSRGRHPRQRQPHDDALSAGPGGHARRQDRQHPGDGRRTRLRGQQVQPRDPGAAPAGLDLQAHRLRGRGRGGLSALARDGGRPAHRGDRHRRAALGAAELRSRVRRADDAAARALHVAQHHRHQAGHGAGRGGGDQRGHQVRHHDAGSAVSVDPHRLGGRDPARDDRRLHHLRQPRHPHHAERHPPGRGPQRQDRLAAAGALGLGHGHARTPGS